jgi:hypothetical protein
MARSASRTTTDHEEIRRWAEERGGQPAEVEGTERGANDTGIIRLDFPGYAGTPPLRHISWDEWFGKFDDSGLALVYQERTAGGQKSNFNKLVARETAEARERGERGASRRPARRRRTTGGRGAAASRAGRASAAARRRKGTGRTRRTAGRTTSRGVGQGRRKAPRASAARTAGRGAAKGRRAAGGAAKRPAGGRRSAKSAARRGGRRASSRSRSR